MESIDALSEKLSDYLDSGQIEQVNKAFEFDNEILIESYLQGTEVSVGVMNYKGKRKNTSVKSSGKVLRTSGFRSSWKKAVITLKEGFSIDLMSGGPE